MKVRFPKFDFTNVRAHWSKDLEFAQTLNGGSLIPAYIEPYLLKVMRKAYPLLDQQDSKLLKDVDVFMKQEMQHCKHHINFNKTLHRQGYIGLLPMEQALERKFQHFLERKSLRFNLAYCEGFESISASACVAYFEEWTDLLEGADPEAADLWRWHVAEEFEHRCVASDVYHALSGLNPVSAYFYRIYGYLYALIHLGMFQAKAAKYLIAKDRETMTSDELAASIARQKVVGKRMKRGAIAMMISILSPFYDPKKRREPRGLQAFLDTFDTPAAAPIAA